MPNIESIHETEMSSLREEMDRLKLASRKLNESCNRDIEQANSQIRDMVERHEAVMVHVQTYVDEIEILKRALRLALIEGRHFFKGSWVHREGSSALGESLEQMFIAHRITKEDSNL